MPNAPQKALGAHRRRRRGGGMVRVEVQVPAIDAPILRDLAAILRGKSDVAQATRNQFRSVVAKPRADSVFDIFGSDLPDAYFDGVFEQRRQRDTPRAGNARWTRSE
jgi:hypothetical protein